jgi:transposase
METPMALKLKDMSADELDSIKKLARSRSAAARLVERAKIILLADKGHKVPAIAAQLKLTESTVRTWLKRFNSSGLAGLNDHDRSGRPAMYTPDEVAEVIAASLLKPEKLGLPFGCWTMDRLAAYLKQEKSIAISRSRTSELLIAEGLGWRTQETWFGERVDPDFAEKRGASRRSTQSHLKVAG